MSASIFNTGGPSGDFAPNPGSVYEMLYPLKHLKGQIRLFPTTASLDGSQSKSAFNLQAFPEYTSYSYDNFFVIA